MDASYELYHHGIKGMHWGVWNEETTRRRNGGIGSSIGRSIAKSVHKSRVKSANQKANKASNKLMKSEREYNRARISEELAGQKYVAKSDEYTKAANKSDKMRNGLYAKTIGYSNSQIRKADVKTAQAKRSLDIAAQEYDSAKAKKLIKESEYKRYQEIADAAKQKESELAKSYIDKYGLLYFDNYARVKGANPFSPYSKGPISRSYYTYNKNGDAELQELERLDPKYIVSRK